MADRPREPVEDVAGGRGAHVAEGIRAGGCERQAAEPDEPQEQGMRRHPDGDTRSAGGDLIRHHGFLRKDEGEGPRPEPSGEPERLGIELGHVSGLADRGDVHDERVGRGTALCGEDPAGRPGVERVAGKPVHGFSRGGHQLPAPELGGEQREVASRRLVQACAGGRHVTKKAGAGRLRPKRGALDRSLTWRGACSASASACG